MANTTAGRAQEVLFERESSAWDIAPGRKAGQELARDIAATLGTDNAIGKNRETGLTIAYGGNNTTGAIDIAPALNAGAQNRIDFESEMFVCNAFNGYTGGADDNDAQGHHIVTGTLPAEYGKQGGNGMANIGNGIIPILEMSHADEAVRNNGNIVPTLQQRMGTGGNQVPMVGVRRLTPVECELLQGFEPGYTDGQPDSVRYRQLGNAVCTKVSYWIAKRIIMVYENSCEP